jgi:predicted phage tail protein
VAVPPSPSLISPADGAVVSEPFTISWTPVSDPTGIVAYNWQVSSSSAFTSVLVQSSTNGATQDTVSGLADGSYFWRVQAVNGDFVQGTWSQPRSFTLTGAGTGSPGSPSLGPTQGYSTFHPFEVITFNWTAVADAASYELQYSTDPSFPVLSSGSFDNIPNTTFSFAVANPEGNYFERVFAVDAKGVLSAPSKVISFAVSN